jgi:hypothetical protein
MHGAPASRCSTLSMTSSRCLTARKRWAACSYARQHDDPECVVHGGGDGLGPLDGGKRDEARAVGEIRRDGARDLHGEPRLADPAGPGQRDQPRGFHPQPSRQRTKLPVAANRPVRRRGKHPGTGSRHGCGAGLPRDVAGGDGWRR